MLGIYLTDKRDLFIQTQKSLLLDCVNIFDFREAYFNKEITHLLVDTDLEIPTTEVIRWNFKDQNVDEATFDLYNLLKPYGFVIRFLPGILNSEMITSSESFY